MTWPSNGQGSASAFVVLTFDRQQFSTTIKENDLNPVWDERFYFNVSDPTNIHECTLEAYVCGTSKYDKDTKSFLGRVSITGRLFVPFPDAVVKGHKLHSDSIEMGYRYRLELEGRLALKVYITLDNPVPPVDGGICSPDRHDWNNLGSILQNQSSRPHSIPLQQLKEITNNFSDELILGQGGFGVVYKGVLQSGEMIAVKKIVLSLMPGLQKQFENEVYHLMMLKYPHIVRCVVYCYETQNACLEYNGKYVFAEMAEKLLCLEYLTMETLISIYQNAPLFCTNADESSGLNWSTRYNIIEGICYGLCYLHEEIDKPIIHLDLKPANILLDDDMVPKITDFGLSRLLDQQQTICTSSRDGTFGYMAPEFLHGGKITPKSDIFSLGVIIMEIVSGHRDYLNITRTPLDDFIELVLEKWRNVLQRLPRYGSLERDCEQIKRCIQVGLICVNPDRTKRPLITNVISMLQGLESIDATWEDAGFIKGLFPEF